MRTSGRIMGLVLAAALAAGVLVTTPSLAAPTNPAIAAKRAEADRVRAELAEMNARLEARIEEYNAIDEELQETRGRIRALRARREEAAEELERSRALLSRRVADMYRSGGTSMVDVLLGTSSFGDLLTRVDLLVRIGRQDAGLVERVSAAKREIEVAEQALQIREIEQVTLRERAEAQSDRVRAGIADQKAYLARVDAEVRTLVTRERERQEALARERARRAAEEAARRAAAIQAAKRAATGKDGSVPTGGASTGGESTPGEGSGGPHPEVVDVALRYIGVPYVWGGSTPEGFDCSGLVQYCYRQVGIELPRTSRSQAGVGTWIPRDDLGALQPGDLVFFGYDGDAGQIHHVGIYVGNGGFVHAPQTGENVQISSLSDRIAARGDYVGAARP